jgi:hypothetical protein
VLTRRQACSELAVLIACSIVSLLMVTAITILQFAFLFLGTITLHGILNANVNISSSVYFQFLAAHWLWFFLIPVLFDFFALISYRIDKGPFKRSVIGPVGGFLSGLCFIYLASVVFFPKS